MFFLPIVAIFISCNKKNNNTPTPVTNNETIFLSNTKIVFTTKEEASKLLGQSDAYTQKLTSFDIVAKTQNTNAKQESDYLSYAASQATAWTATEIDQMMTTIARVEAKIKKLKLKLKLPSEIKLVKSTINEEGGAEGYTRVNFIVLQKPPSEDLFLHELFHIYSRENPDKRDAMYKTIHFEKCNVIRLPNVITNQGITNPDAPTLEHFLTAQIDGKPQEMVIITYAGSPYKGGSFFDYLQKKMMIVEGSSINKVPTLVNNQPVMKDFSDISNLDALIGINTDYNIHPEEILAEHFTFLILQRNVPNPVFLDNLKQLLQ